MPLVTPDWPARRHENTLPMRMRNTAMPLLQGTEHHSWCLAQQSLPRHTHPKRWQSHTNSDRCRTRARPRPRAAQCTAWRVRSTPCRVTRCHSTTCCCNLPLSLQGLHNNATYRGKTQGICRHPDTSACLLACKYTRGLLYPPAHPHPTASQYTG